MVDLKNFPSTSMFTFKFTIDFCYPILVANKYNLVSSSSKLMDNELLFDKLELKIVENNLKDNYELLNESNSNLFSFLQSQAHHDEENIEEAKSADFDSSKAKLAYLLNFKLGFFEKELHFSINDVNSNEKLGQKVIYLFKKCF